MFATVSMVSGYLLADSFFQKACWISHFFYLCDIRIAFFKATFVGCLVSERESALGSIPVGVARCHHGRRTLRTFGGYEAQHRKCLEIMMPRLRHSPRSFQRLVMLAKHNTRIHCRFSLRTWNVIIMVLLMAEILPTTQFYHSLSQYFFRVYTYIITSLNNSDISVMVSVFVHQMSAPGSPGGDPLGPTNRQVRASGTHRHES